MIDFYITQQSIRFASPVIAANSFKYLEARFFFSGDWDGFSKWAHFRQGDTVFDLNLTDDMISAEMGLNLSLGQWEVFVTGSDGERRLTTVPVILSVKESGLIDEPLHSIPMSVAEQIDAKASTALLMAQAVKDAADDGKFDGKSFEIKGFYNSAEELAEAQENPLPGDIYGIGTGEPYDLYIWDGVGSAWVNNGKLQGAKGDDGARGVTFTPSVESNGNLSWTNDGGLENPETVNIMGAKGDKGDKGDDGKSPYQAACEAGYTGTEQTFNAALTSFPYHNVRHLPDGADPITVKTGNIEDGAVTTAKIASGAVSRAKLAQDALFSPLVSINSNSTPEYNITPDDTGKTIRESARTAPGLIVTFTKDVSNNLPIGAEFAVLDYSKTSRTKLKFVNCNVIVAGHDAFYGSGTTTTIFEIADCFTLVAVKKIATNSGVSLFLLTGNVEVAE